MALLIKRGEVFYQQQLQKLDILISDGFIQKIAVDIAPEEHKIIDANGLVVLPGLVDIHTHLREPGFEYKETIRTGTQAAAHGGFTTICCMPNLHPVTDSVANIQHLTDLIKKHAIIRVLPYAAITIEQKGKELVNMPQLAKYCFAFSDDGCPVDDQQVMYKAMTIGHEIKKCIVAHAQDSNLSPRGVIHPGVVAQRYHLPTIQSASEYLQIMRDCKMAAKTKCQYHACHVSCSESVNFMRHAKKLFFPVSCEATVHHLLLDQTYVKNWGIYKINPPLRDRNDRLDLVRGLEDGTIDLIVTDHAPHAENEKKGNFKNSAFGIAGLDYAFGLIYTNFVRTNIISMKRLVDLMSFNPHKLFGLKTGVIDVGQPADLAIFDLNRMFTIKESFICSKSKLTPFEGFKCYGVTIYTIVGGKIVYNYNHG
ncbi:MAG: dihydroorotase [Mycoplasmataceae bacterium]|jgi:dihydroorotase|nr:dihydroorotase [Mycoplasmataceae bacterium]